VTAKELLDVLQGFYRAKLAMVRRHEAAARHISDYDFNNTYQYVIAREDMQVRWVGDAIVAADGQLDSVAEPTIEVSGKGKESQDAVIKHDLDAAQAFVDKWNPIVATVTNARHRTMLNVILGETLEHKRFFEQALAGRSDLLGRHTEGPATKGVVLPTRWIEQ
jgi:hypothetical protein